MADPRAQGTDADRAADTPARLARLHHAAFADSRPWSAAEFAGLLSAPHCLLCEATDSFALARVIADEAELLTIATHPRQRRRGQARMLLARFHAEARARGATRAFLEVAADNAAARALYAGAGYREIGRRRGYYARPDGSKADALVLSRPLGNPGPAP